MVVEFSDIENHGCAPTSFSNKNLTCFRRFSQQILPKISAMESLNFSIMSKVFCSTQTFECSYVKLNRHRYQKLTCFTPSNCNTGSDEKVSSFPIFLECLTKDMCVMTSPSFSIVVQIFHLEHTFERCRTKSTKLPDVIVFFSIELQWNSCFHCQLYSSVFCAFALKTVHRGNCSN